MSLCTGWPRLLALAQGLRLVLGVHLWAMSPCQPWSFRAWALERGRERERKATWQAGLGDSFPAIDFRRCF